MDAERASGAAKRRRERRLRSWWRHERMTVAAELAVALHHSRGVGPAVPHAALRGQTPASSVGRRPGVLEEPVPPVVVDRVQRHYMEDLGTVCPYVQILHLSVPQMVDNVTDTLRILDHPIAEQVIEVPKIYCSPCPSRSVVPVPQSAEQLVEVPTTISYSSLFQQTLEQNVDIPTSVRGVSRSLHGFLPEQYSSQRTASQIADIPVPGRGDFGCLGFPPEQGTTALHVAQERISERIELIDAGGDFPSRRAFPRVFRPRQRSAAAGAEQLADIVSHGPDHVDEHLPESAEWVQLRDEATSRPYFWNRRTRETKWKPPPGIRVVWVGEKGSGEEVWYWHKGTRASTYELPLLPPE